MTVSIIAVERSFEISLQDPAIAMKSDYETYTNGRNVGAYVRVWHYCLD